MTVPLPPPIARPSLPATVSRRLVSSRSGVARRAAKLVAQARRGNLFLDPSSVPKDDGLTGLFDSSRFNEADSDDELQQRRQEQQQKEQQQEQQQKEREPGSTAPVLVDASGELVPPPAPHNTRVKSAEFIKSSVSSDQCPPACHPEFAVIGRSNVGKSSLINMLTGRASLAMVSKTPGKTRCINHFLINDSWYLVDLPGYGYAKTSKTNVLNWNEFTRQYFLERETLACVFLLIDASIPPMPLDLACAQWFAEVETPYTLVFTKSDKRKKGLPRAEANIAAFEEELSRLVDYLPPALVTSSKSGHGKTEVLAYIAQVRDLFNKAPGGHGRRHGGSGSA